MGRMNMQQLLQSPAAQSCLQTFFSPKQVTVAIIKYRHWHGDAVITGERLCELILESESSDTYNSNNSSNNSGNNNNRNCYSRGYKNKSNGDNNGNRSDIPGTNKHKVQQEPGKSDDGQSGLGKDSVDTDGCWMCKDLLENVTQLSWCHVLNCPECSAGLYGYHYTNHAYH